MHLLPALHLYLLSISTHACISAVQTVFPDSKFHGASMGPTWVLSAPDGPHVGPMNPAIRVVMEVQWWAMCTLQWHLTSVMVCQITCIFTFNSLSKLMTNEISKLRITCCLFRESINGGWIPHRKSLKCDIMVSWSSTFFCYVYV